MTLAALIAIPAVAEDDIPRLADGKPDLSGFYDIATLTPLQRPEMYGDKLFLTADEARAIAEEEQALLARANERSDPNRAAPSDTGAAPVGLPDSQRENFGAGNVGGYNAFWIERGSSAVSIDDAYRTSIITEPANGRMPPITDAARERRVTCTSPSGSPGSTRTRCTTSSPSMTRRPGPGPGRATTSGRRLRTRSTSTPATKATTRWATSCAARACSKRRPWPPPGRAAASSRTH